MMARARFPDLPSRMRRLKVDHRGFPVPWFCHWQGDEPQFHMLGKGKFSDAVKKRLCWICGEKLGRHLAFVIGPMCVINRITSEPPSHRECAIFAAKNCPFLSRPRMRRVPLEGAEMMPAGVHLDRNPGAAAVWVTESYQVFQAGRGTPGNLIALGAPTEILWFAEGQPAGRAAVAASIAGGLPTLRELAARDGKAAEQELAEAIARAYALLPAA